MCFTIQSLDYTVLLIVCQFWCFQSNFKYICFVINMFSFWISITKLQGWQNVTELNFKIWIYFHSQEFILFDLVSIFLKYYTAIYTSCACNCYTISRRQDREVSVNAYASCNILTIHLQGLLITCPCINSGYIVNKVIDV